MEIKRRAVKVIGVDADYYRLKNLAADAAAGAVAASISWGFVVGDPEEPSRGFLSHNVGFRWSVCEQIRYREDLGRTDELVRNGLSIKFQPGQRARHLFTWRWWLTRLHVRF